MKVMSIIGFILAALSVIGGVIISTNSNLPMQGFSAVIVGFVVGALFALPSTALVGILQLRKALTKSLEK